MVTKKQFMKEMIRVYIEGAKPTKEELKQHKELLNQEWEEQKDFLKQDKW